MLDEVRQHYYDVFAKGTKPDDPGWHSCRCGWQGYWCDYEPHVAERIVGALRESAFLVEKGSTQAGEQRG